MGYFSNGTEGDFYEDKYCSRCVHRNGQDGSSGCHVMLSHIIHAYKMCGSEEAGEDILNMLIPLGKDGFNEQCSMFHEGAAIPDPSVKHVSVMPSMQKWAQQRGLA